MSRPDDLARLARLEGLPRDVDGPVFAEPWQAQALALTVQLSEAGCFTWQEWAAELAAVMREAATREPRDDGSQYYDWWVFALERLCLSKGLTNRQALRERRTAWIEAYCRTPHGRPVELSGR